MLKINFDFSNITSEERSESIQGIYFNIQLTTIYLYMYMYVQFYVYAILLYICIAIVAIICNNNYYRPPSVYCFELLRKLHRQYMVNKSAKDRTDHPFRSSNDNYSSHRDNELLQYFPSFFNIF